MLPSRSHRTPLVGGETRSRQSTNCSSAPPGVIEHPWWVVKHDHVNPRIVQAHRCCTVNVVFNELPSASNSRSDPCRSLPVLDAVRNLDNSIGPDVITNQDIHPDTVSLRIITRLANPKEPIPVTLTDAKRYNFAKKFTVQ